MFTKFFFGKKSADTASNNPAKSNDDTAYQMEKRMNGKCKGVCLRHKLLEERLIICIFPNGSALLKRQYRNHQGGFHSVVYKMNFQNNYVEPELAPWFNVKQIKQLLEHYNML